MLPGVTKNRATLKRAFRVSGKPAFHWPAGVGFSVTSHRIVKGSDDNTPFPGFNELYSMRVLDRLGVAPVARTQMARDGRALIIERFGIDALGVPAYGVEDICCLLGCNGTPPGSRSFTPESMAWRLCARRRRACNSRGLNRL
jgi:hypothetical protein